MDAFEALMCRFEKAVQRLEMAAAVQLGTTDVATKTASPATNCQMLDAFDSSVLNQVDCFRATCKSIGDVVADIGSLVDEAFRNLRQFMTQAVGMTEQEGKKQLDDLLNPLSTAVDKIGRLADQHRKSPFCNHLSAISQSVPAFAWVTLATAPAPFVGDMIDAAQFYLNRILKDFKDQDPLHKQFVQQWLEVLNNLKSFIKQYHTTGFVWNSAPQIGTPKGSSAVSSPPPPPPPGLLNTMLSTPKAAGNNQTNARLALFADINKGTEITKSLKKVTADMQTHKNPALRCASPAQTDKPKVAAKPAHLSSARTPKASAAQAPAVFELQGGKKWMIENQTDQTLTVTVDDMKQVVYVYRCLNTTVQVKGKLNSITLDACKGTKVVFDNLVSSLELINCTKIDVQTLGTLPTVVVQNTDGCNMYLSNDSLDCEVISSRSSAMNLLVPGDDGQFLEYSIPEQFKTVWTGNSLRSLPTEA